MCIRITEKLEIDKYFDKTGCEAMLNIGVIIYNGV
jgi:hypothetical protein